MWKLLYNTVEATGPRSSVALCKYVNISFRSGPFILSVNGWFGISAPALASYLINLGCKPILEWLTWFIKKSKQFNQSDATNNIATLTLSLRDPYVHLICLPPANEVWGKVIFSEACVKNSRSTPRGKLRGLAGDVSRPTPGMGCLQAHTGGGCLQAHTGGVYPSMH